MGIDIYAHWKNQTEDERTAQSSEWLSARAGSAGYLREAYHGSPYATPFLCREAFHAKSFEARIPAATLRKRLAETLAIVEARERALYQSSNEEIEQAQQSYRDFVALCERKETETGEAVQIIASY